MAVAYLEGFPNLRIAWPLSEKLNYVFALAKGSDLTPLLNAHIQKLKSSGAFYALLARFYGQKGLAILKASESPEGGNRP
jgi:ABC-type amino acid transport substrate-binding protein